MLISELSARTGTSVATLKFYLREGLLMPGTALSATRSDYGEDHVRRVGVARALTDVVGLSVQQAREIFRLFGTPRAELFESLGRAMAQLPPAGAPEADDYPRARAVLERLGWLYDPRYAAVPQLEQRSRRPRVRASPSATLDWMSTPPASARSPSTTSPRYPTIPSARSSTRYSAPRSTNRC